MKRSAALRVLYRSAPPKCALLALAHIRDYGSHIRLIPSVWRSHVPNGCITLAW
jgi:hypothetical protein